MKICFEEPNVEVVRFFAEDAITTSGMRTGGMNPGFDEVEPDMDDYVPWLPMIHPCG